MNQLNVSQGWPSYASREKSPRATNEVITLSAVAIWRCLHLDIWTKLHGKMIDDCDFCFEKRQKALSNENIYQKTHKLPCLRFFKISLVVGEWREHNHLHMKFNMNTAYAFSSVGHPTYQYHPALFPGKKTHAIWTMFHDRFMDCWRWTGMIIQWWWELSSWWQLLNVPSHSLSRES